MRDDDGDDGSRFAGSRRSDFVAAPKKTGSPRVKGFHDAAAPPVPMKPLVVRFQARAFTPRLTADEPANLLAYACDACVDRSEASHFRSVTLTNDNAEEIGFSLTCSDPFQIFDVEASTPQLGLGRETTPARSARAGIEPSEFKTIPWRVPAGENVHVTVRSAPPLPDVDDEGVVDRADYVAEGALVVLYDSDDVQHFLPKGQRIATRRWRRMSRRCARGGARASPGKRETTRRAHQRYPRGRGVARGGGREKWCVSVRPDGVRSRARARTDARGRRRWRCRWRRGRRCRTRRR